MLLCTQASQRQESNVQIQIKIKTKCKENGAPPSRVNQAKEKKGQLCKNRGQKQNYDGGDSY